MMAEGDKCQKLQTVIGFKRHQLLKKALQFLLSLSLFSFFFSYSSTFPLFVCSFNLYFSTFPFQLFDQTIDRKYMFLLCNVILVFLAGSSGLISSLLETADFHDELRSRRRNRDELRSRRRKIDDLHGESEFSGKKASASEEEVVLGSVEAPENALVVGGGGNGCLITEEEENGHLIAVDGEIGFSTAAAAAEEEEEEEELSREELNRKCDDFIRWMKGGIKTEAQRQLVMV